ncbi:hypothetical protein HYT04_01890 [Candidatus Kaiserbacteria bacterium]|nr:hypothetical protein [Candidatus Kaiserbacteria bacterium]
MNKSPHAGEGGVSLIGVLAAVLLLGMAAVIAFETAQEPIVSGPIKSQVAASHTTATTKDNCGEPQFLASKTTNVRDVKKDEANLKQNCVPGCTYVVSPYLGATPTSGGKKVAGAKVVPFEKTPKQGVLACSVWRCNKDLDPGDHPVNHNGKGCAPTGTFSTKEKGWWPWSDWVDNPNASADLTKAINKTADGVAAEQLQKLLADSKRDPASIPSDLDSNTLNALKQALANEDPYTESSKANVDAAREKVQKQLDELAKEEKNTTPGSPTGDPKINPEVSAEGSCYNDSGARWCFPKNNTERVALEKIGHNCVAAGDGTYTCSLKTPPGTLLPKPKPAPETEFDRIFKDFCVKNPSDSRCKAASTCPGGNCTGFNNSNNNKEDPWKFTTGQGQWGQQTLPQRPPAAGNGQPYPQGTCSPSVLCANNTLYARNNQCVDQVMQQCQYGCSGTQCAQQPQQGQGCPSAPPSQPDPSGCQNGSWRPTYNGACVSGWQCVPTGGTGGGSITAQLSCQPQVADVGMTIAITFSCSSGVAEGSGFETGGAQSGLTTATIANPPASANVATYGLKCTDGSASATKQCSIQIAKPAIVLVANPKVVKKNKTSTIGWVTSDEHKDVKNVNGTVTTPKLKKSADFVLKCTTIGGSTKEATTRVRVD